MSDNIKSEGGWRSQLLGSMLWGFVPLIVVLADGASNPFMFMAAWGFAGGIACLTYVFVLNKDLLSHREIKYFFQKNVKVAKANKFYFISVFSLSRIFFFAWSIKYFSGIISAVLYETLPIFFTPLIMKGVFKDKEDDKKLNIRNIILLGFVSVGIFFIIFSSTLESSQNFTFWNINFVYGGVLILLATLLGGREDIFAKISGMSMDKKQITEGENKNESVIGSQEVGRYILTCSFSFFIAGLIGLLGTPFFSGSLGWEKTWYVFVAGFVIGGIGSAANAIGIFKSKTNSTLKIRYFVRYLFTSNFGALYLLLYFFVWGHFWVAAIVAMIGLWLGSTANAIGIYVSDKNPSKKVRDIFRYLLFDRRYFPLFFVLYLFWLGLHKWSESYIDGNLVLIGVRDDLFILGLCAISAGVTLISLDIETRFGLASLVIGTWISGYIVLFRDGTLGEWFPDGAWIIQRDNYFSLLALSATAFTLLLAFRITRLSGRVNEEEKLVFSLLSKLDFIAAWTIQNIKNTNSNSVNLSKFENIIHQLKSGIDELKKIDYPENSVELQNTYVEVRQILVDLREPMIENGRAEDVQSLSEAQAELDTLVHSKQYGHEHAEPASVVLLGFLTLAITLITRPAAGSLIAFIFDGFGFIFAGVIVFLTLHIFDLRRERSTSIIEEHPDFEYYQVKFVKGGQKHEWVLSMIATAVVIVAITYLIWIKWV